jgi:hypothetical protein
MGSLELLLEEYEIMVVRKSRSYIKKSTLSNEERLAKITDSVRQPASGATKWFKGDFKNDMFLFDNKKSFSDKIQLSKSMFDQVLADAKQHGLIPCLSLTCMNHDFWILPLRNITIDPREDVELIQMNKSKTLRIQRLIEKVMPICIELKSFPKFWMLLNNEEFFGDKYVKRNN